jgi:hypothetical protein
MLKIKKDEEKTDDCFQFYRTVISDFDLAIVNVADQVQLNLVSPKLIKAFHEIDEEQCYKKFELIISGLRRMVGNGVAFA